MSRNPYGPIIQNAWVVADMDAAIDFWTGTMGVGPFFKFPTIVWETGFYRGTAMLPDYEAAMAYTGDLVIELIKPNGPSIFMEALEAGVTGIQHMCAFAEDLGVATEAIVARGGKAIQGGTFADGSALTYFDMGGPESTILEIAQLSAPVHGLFAMIKDAGANWDGVTKVTNF